VGANMDVLTKRILERLLNNRCIGKHHILEINIRKGFDRKDHGKIKEKLKELENKGYINKHPTCNGDAYAVTYAKLEEIWQQLKSS
jgi:hypothetical protein